MLGVMVAQSIGSGVGKNPGFAEINPAVTMAMTVAGVHGSGGAAAG